MRMTAILSIPLVKYSRIQVCLQCLQDEEMNRKWLGINLCYFIRQNPSIYFERLSTAKKKSLIMVADPGSKFESRSVRHKEKVLVA